MNTTPHQLRNGNFAQDWTNIGLITANDDWSGVASIVGYLGDTNAGSPVDVDPRTLTAAATGALDVIANLTATTSNSGGVGEFQIANPTIGFQGSGTADTPGIVLYLDSTATQDVRLRANIRDIDSTVVSSVEENAAQQLNVQYRTDPAGAWINVPGGYFADVTALGATMFTALDIILPVGANNSANLQVRIFTTNATGSDEWVGIDDILVSATSAAGATGTFAVTADAGSITEGDSGFVNATFAVARTGGVSGAATVNYTLSGITLDDLASGALTGTADFADGASAATITVAIRGDRTVEASETLSVLLTGSTAGTNVSATPATTVITNDDVAGTVTIADVTVLEGGGNALLTVTRSGGGGDIGVGYATASGTATAGSDFAATTGTLNFANGSNSETISVPITQDVLVEGTESFTLNLTSGTGSPAIGRAAATVTITDDDTLPSLTINDPTVTEGANGTVTLTYTVTSSVAAPAGGISFDIATADGTATAGSDYVARAVTGATIAAGSTTYSFAVTVNGDTVFEPNETILVNVTNATNAVIADGQGSGTIVNDDTSSVVRLLNENFATFTAAGFSPPRPRGSSIRISGVSLA